MTPKQAAAHVFEKCGQSIYGQFAVILSPDKSDVRLTSPKTRLLERTLETTPELFVGVYDINSHEEDIHADLIHSGMLS